MKYTNLLLATFCLLGVVDQIHGDTVRAEVTDSEGNTELVGLPTWLFPCKISEGDMFYFTRSDGVLELRCGEPQE